MTFLNPFVLFGLFAASLPVLFHLFAQRKARRVEFTSLRFLKKLERSSMRTAKLRQLLLLIIRTLLIIAVVMAFARPALKGYLGSFFGSSHASSTLVFLVDNSASMSRSDERGELLKQSKDAAHDIAALMEDGDEAVILPLASIPHGGSIPQFIHGRQDVLKAIGDLHLDYRPAELADGFRMASTVLAKSLNVNKEIYLLTDGQARNLKERDGLAIANADTIKRKSNTPDSATAQNLKLFDDRTKLFYAQLGSGETGGGVNLSIDSLKPITTIFEPGRPIEFEAWIRNTMEVASPGAAIWLYYNDERVAQRTIPAVAPHQSERITIAAPPRNAGTVSVRLELEPDALPFDNKRFAVLTVPATRHIGIFVQNPGDMIFLRLALEQSLGEGGTQSFTTEFRKLDEIRTLAATGARYDGVIVGVSGAGLAQEDADALHNYVTSGHGVALFLLQGLDIPTFNSQTAVRLGIPNIEAKQGTPNDNEHYASFAQIDFSHPFFSGMFESTQSGENVLRGIESPHFFEYYALAKGRSLTLLKLSTGVPFLSEFEIAKSKMLVFSAPPNLAFSDMPRKSIFLPLMRRAAAYICSIRSTDENNLSTFLTTEPFDVPLPLLSGEQPGSTVLIKSPDGTFRAPVLADALGRMRVHLDAAGSVGNYGVYRDAEAKDQIGAFAVNIQSDESDLTPATPAETKAFLAKRMSKPESIITIDPAKKGLAERILQSRFGVELWQSFLWAALILALLEMLIAREAKNTVLP
jgi:hypothetical protein